MSEEALGVYVLTDQARYFPKASGNIYEPEGTKWICTPLYADPSRDYYRLVHGKCKPISFYKSLTAKQVQQALTDVLALREKN